VSKFSNSSSGGVGIAGPLLVLFIGLKLGHVIAWSWWWVLAPLWLPLLIVAAAFLVIILPTLVRRP